MAPRDKTNTIGLSDRVIAMNIDEGFFWQFEAKGEQPVLSEVETMSQVRLSSTYLKIG